MARDPQARERANIWTDRALLWRSPHRHLYAIGLAIITSIWIVELEVFNRAASTASCPWPSLTPASQASRTKRAVVPQTDERSDEAFHLLVLADPQILWTHAYPNLTPWLRRLPPWLADHYIRKVYRALLRKWDTDSSERVDAVVWLGDLTDEGRRSQTDEEWVRMYDHFDHLFPFQRSQRRRNSHRASSADERFRLLPRPSELPFLYTVGNHDVPIPRKMGQASDVESDSRAKRRFTERYGAPVVSQGPQRFQAVTPSASAKATRSLNAVFHVSVGGHSTTHEIVLLDAMDLIAMQRDTRPNIAPYGQPLDKLVRQAFPSTYDFVESLSKERSKEQHRPRVIFSHVPLWRPTPGIAENNCDIETRSRKHGVRREHPSRGLYQDTDRYDTYQNLLSKPVSDWIVKKIGWSGGAVLSGDDHDHCEYVHNASSTSGALGPTVQDFGREDLPELTVKSMSMTMGVRKPGFARITLFAPSSTQDATNPSMAYTPCLLPDRVGLSIKAYGMLTLCGLFVLTAVHNSTLASIFGKVLPFRLSTHRKKASDTYKLLPTMGSGARDARAKQVRRRVTGLVPALKDLGLLLALFAVYFYLAVAIL
ncbi:hypothetical protein K437DRAFT_292420 [Tilletiaria anomala UBC 951]|uniref:Calcineurin-like phosphoesterase domain-containing protein n=1 Tax=Tilletiaria anomala (strain ATCC 24038 / CBS 436.72 / UBC 951) TaxID=1037660 RepID=A0A066WKW5_TILAU|nr:uncharacterized protein K437DRAFT_292420 [Tilletiaria anomala UBC 951]KDN53218.1 hypothetical protein K437DRAFT_292420 [Tilletiaria anomala UBC 951]